MLSRAAALQILSLRESSECDPLNLKWADRTHQGGDAWLGDCADASGVHIDMEYGFYPQPPVASQLLNPSPNPNLSPNTLALPLPLPLPLTRWPTCSSTSRTPSPSTAWRT